VSLEEEVALLLRQFHCKQQRIYKALPWRAPPRETRATGLATGAARSGIGDPPVKKSRPKAALCVIPCMCGAMARRGTLMQTPGAVGPCRSGNPTCALKKIDLGQARDRRAIPTVDFLLHRFGAPVKKMAVKTQD
jgi:hypothetical protein